MTVFAKMLDSYWRLLRTHNREWVPPVPHTFQVGAGHQDLKTNPQIIPSTIKSPTMPSSSHEVDALVARKLVYHFRLLDSEMNKMRACITLMNKYQDDYGLSHAFKF